MLTRPQLELGLLAHPPPGLGRDPRRSLTLGARELRERTDARDEQLLDLPPADPGDPGQMIDPVPVGLTHRLEVADPAVLARPGLGRGRSLKESFESRTNATVVGAELIRPKRPQLTRPEQDVNP